MKRIAIIGGGISGLSAAFRLEQKKKQGLPLEYVLIEAGSRFGGVIQTERVDECVIEAGPDSFLTEKAWAADLCVELGLRDELIPSNDVARKTYIVVKGRLVPLPDGLMFMVPTKIFSAFSSPLFSWTTKLRILREWFYRPVESSRDLSVANFVERHYGHEMVDRVTDPLLAGVYGGSADELSVRSVLPRFVEMEARKGSLGKAMVAVRTQRQSSSRALFTSLRGGMQQITDALLARIPESARRSSSAVANISPESGKWLVMSSGRTEEFDAAIIAAPAYAASRLLQEANAELASVLSGIRYSSSVTVALGYGERVRAELLEGFGFLIPRTESHRCIAATFVHNKFPHRAPDDRALIRCFLGGTRDEAILQLSDDEIAAIVNRDLLAIVGINTEPQFVRIYRWQKAMAQYEVGHRDRIDRIRSLLAEMPGLALAGNYLGGIGVPDCVRAGSEATTKILTDLNIMASDHVGD
jgi:oxygen-dependent protoporphyrinogen oxidase